MVAVFSPYLRFHGPFAAVVAAFHIGGNADSQRPLRAASAHQVANGRDRFRLQRLELAEKFERIAERIARFREVSWRFPCRTRSATAGREGASFTDGLRVMGAGHR